MVARGHGWGDQPRPCLKDGRGAGASAAARAAWPSGRDARSKGDDEDAGAVRRAADQRGPPRRDAEDRGDLRHPAALDLDREPDDVSPDVEGLDLELPSARQREALAEPEGHDGLEGADWLVARVPEDLLEPSRPQPDSHGLAAATARRGRTGLVVALFH